MIFLRLILAALLTISLVPPAVAQSSEPAVLIADRMFIDENGLLIAEGNVEAIQGSLSLTAAQVSYSREENRLRLTGPIRLTDSATGAEFFADEAELEPQLIEGLMRGARLVLDKQLQLAAIELSRSQGRYTQLYKVAATSCKICGDNSPPLWQIRAREVVHDIETRQLYFSDAQFLVLDIPVLAVPKLRMPDPTLSRSNGFLIPSGRSNSLLGVGIKVPYFITLGDHRDITITPYISSETTTVELKYRQAFVNGNLSAHGALSQDTLEAGQLRHYVFASGNTVLPRDFRLNYDIEVTSDTAYLLDYGYSDKDRLDSAATATKAERNLSIEAEAIFFQTLRETETNATQPTLFSQLNYQRRIPDSLLGGEIRFTGEWNAHYRYDGADVTRTRGNIEWIRTGGLPNGIIADTHAQFEIGASAIAQDNTVIQSVFNAVPAVYTNMRWPLQKTDKTASYLFEPIAQLAWSDSVTQLSNEESTRVEFDEANLLDFSRFPAADRVEEGLRIAYGARWSRLSDTGLKTTLHFGQIIRDKADPDLSSSSGLDGKTSDWLIAGQIATPSGIEMISRALVDKGFEFSKAENRLRWRQDRFDLTATHIWLNADPNEDRDQPISEINLSTSVDFGRHWNGLVDWQYDLSAGRIVRTGVGLEYVNECIDMRLAASRRFTDTSAIDPSTDYDFSVGLRGFGAGRSGSDVLRTCGS